MDDQPGKFHRTQFDPVLIGARALMPLRRERFSLQ